MVAHNKVCSSIPCGKIATLSPGVVMHIDEVLHILVLFYVVALFLVRASPNYFAGQCCLLASWASIAPDGLRWKSYPLPDCCCLSSSRSSRSSLGMNSRRRRGVFSIPNILDEYSYSFASSLSLYTTPKKYNTLLQIV
jgi:hypothetical protein